MPPTTQPTNYPTWQATQYHSSWVDATQYTVSPSSPGVRIYEANKTFTGLGSITNKEWYSDDIVLPSTIPSSPSDTIATISCNNQIVNQCKLCTARSECQKSTEVSCISNQQVPQSAISASFGGSVQFTATSDIPNFGCRFTIATYQIPPPTNFPSQVYTQSESGRFSSDNAAIAIGIIVAVGLLVILAGLFLYRRRKIHQSKGVDILRQASVMADSRAVDPASIDDIPCPVHVPAIEQAVANPMQGHGP